MDVGRQFERAVSTADISGFRFHDLRHTAATRRAANGVDPFTLAYIFGWSDIQMAMRYTHATNANMKQAVRSLGNLFGADWHRVGSENENGGNCPAVSH